MVKENEKRQAMTKDDIQRDFRKWCSGQITRHDMSKKDWNSFKRRINRLGLKKKPSDFITSQKDCTRVEWLQKKAAYQRARYAKQKRRSVEFQHDGP
jgi:hypothetical protein